MFLIVILHLLYHFDATVWFVLCCWSINCQVNVVGVFLSCVYGSLLGDNFRVNINGGSFKGLLIYC